MRSAALVLCALTLLPAGASHRQPARAEPAFAARIAELSEPAGYFDTDNLISNERSFLQVVPDLKARHVSGGAYLGVGPDQNFSYIAQVRPRVAFIIDVRRDNLLLHLLFKALFAASRTRAEYLALLTGRPAPEPLDAWRDATMQRIVGYVDATAAVAPQRVQALRTRLNNDIQRYGVRLTAADLATIDRFHRAFIAEGLSLRFQSHGRPPRSYYPTYRELLLETDRAGRACSYLASEADFQFVRSLEARDLVIPVVGDLSGPHAMTAIGRMMAEQGDRLSVLYVSNVENYLFQDGRFPRFVENLRGLPRDDRSVVIRAVFDGFRASDTGYASTSVVQSANDLVTAFARGCYRSYWELVGAR